eukprot:scaffold1449_cov244-Pinguiococcus_pyrenoidosus.AAC.2
MRRQVGRILLQALLASTPPAHAHQLLDLLSLLVQDVPRALPERLARDADEIIARPPRMRDLLHFRLLQLRGGQDGANGAVHQFAVAVDRNPRWHHLDILLRVDEAPQAVVRVQLLRPFRVQADLQLLGSQSERWQLACLARRAEALALSLLLLSTTTLRLHGQHWPLERDVGRVGDEDVAVGADVEVVLCVALLLGRASSHPLARRSAGFQGRRASDASAHRVLGALSPVHEGDHVQEALEAALLRLGHLVGHPLLGFDADGSVGQVVLDVDPAPGTKRVAVKHSGSLHENCAIGDLPNQRFPQLDGLLILRLVFGLPVVPRLVEGVPQEVQHSFLLGDLLGGARLFGATRVVLAFLELGTGRPPWPPGSAGDDIDDMD